MRKRHLIQKVNQGGGYQGGCLALTSGEAGWRVEMDDEVVEVNGG